MQMETLDPNASGKYIHALNMVYSVKSVGNPFGFEYVEYILVVELTVAQTHFADLSYILVTSVLFVSPQLPMALSVSNLPKIISSELALDSSAAAVNPEQIVHNNIAIKIAIAFLNCNKFILPFR